MNENEEIKINFRDYMLYSLKKWRSILIIGLIFAVLAAGAVALKYALSWDDNMAKYDADIDKYKEEHDAYDEYLGALKSGVDLYEKDYKYEEEYMKNSILVNLDYENVLTVSIELMPIKKQGSEEESYSVDKVELNNVLKAYYNNLYDYADLNAVGELIRYDSEYAKELVDVKVDYNGGSISMVIKYPDEGYSYAISDILISGAKEKVSKIDYFKDYDLVIINQSTETEYSETLKSYINGRKEKFESAKTNYESAKENVEVFLEEGEPAYPEMPNKLSRKHIAVVAVIVGVIGFFAGVFLMFIFYYNKFVRKGIIYSAGEFDRITGVNNLGVFPKNAGKKRIFGFVDRLITKKERNAEEDGSFAIERIKIHLDNLNDVNKLLVIGKNEERCRGILTDLSNRLGEKSFSYYLDFSSNASLKSLYECDGVIFVVEREKTMLPEIIADIKLVKDSDKKIIGNIVL